MDDTWIIFEGKNGIDAIFDDEINKGKRHKRDEALVPFKTKDPYKYEDFSGVVGAFSRIMSNTASGKCLNREELKKNIYERMDDDCEIEDFEKLFQIIEGLYFEDGKLLPISVKALNYIDSNISQRQVAEYLYSLFIHDDLKQKYMFMTEAEDTNIIEQLIFKSLEEEQQNDKIAVAKADCFLPYIREVFCKDYEILTRSASNYQKYISRFLAYYYMFYVSQLAVKLSKFEHGKRNEIEKIYMTLYDEVVTKIRIGYEYGWKYVKDKIGHMFSHSVLMEMLAHNTEQLHMDYIGFYERFNGTLEDEQVAWEIKRIQNSYMKWIPLDYSGCKHDDAKNSNCKTSNEIKRLFEIIDYQFMNGGRTSHYNGYNNTFIEFVQKNFGKFRGVNGYTMSVRDSDIIMFTQIILQENGGKVKLTKLFEEFEFRGLLFDRESKRRVIDLYEKMNLLEKRSDSGDAQYVKYIL